MKQTYKRNISVVASLGICLLKIVPNLVIGATLSGEITDTITGTPIAGAIVSLEATSYSDTTDAEGNYFIADVQPGIYTVLITASDYQQIVVSGFQVVDEVLPVELASFTATFVENTVKLKWITATETNNLGFEIQRSQDKTTFRKVGFVRGNGTTAVPHNYSFMDSDLILGLYYYRLKQIDTDGAFSYSSIIEASVEPPTVFSLKQNYPNPFNPSTQIRYHLPQKARVILKVFNLLGEEVDTLVDEWQSAGIYSVTWHGQDLLGSRLASGVYLYQLNADRFTQTRRMVLLQ